MPDTGYSRSPKLLKGALVQLVDGLVGPTPNIIPFQYNPEKLSRSFTPWNPFQVDEANRGQSAPGVQPFDPKESITLTVQLDASDRLEDDDPKAKVFGVADRLAALEKLLWPTRGMLQDLVGSVGALFGNGAPPERATVPIVLFVWGPGRILPVRVTTFTIEEQGFSPTLYPVHAQVNLALEVLTPDVFKCHRGRSADIAVAAYRLYRVQQDALAAAHTATNIDAVRGLLPF